MKKINIEYKLCHDGPDMGDLDALYAVKQSTDHGGDRSSINSPKDCGVDCVVDGIPLVWIPVFGKDGVDDKDRTSKGREEGSANS